MVLFDVNVLIYATYAEAADHKLFRGWLVEVIEGDAAFGVADLVLSSFLRIVTNRKVFAKPSKLSEAIAVTEQIRTRPNCVAIQPGPRHWDIFLDLVRRANAHGNLVPDAYLAALAIESGSEWFTTDRDYARFPGLRWRHPLDP
jgi:toxin-antitoxin system PIN domain toxin